MKQKAKAKLKALRAEWTIEAKEPTEWQATYNSLYAAFPVKLLFKSVLVYYSFTELWASLTTTSLYRTRLGFPFMRELDCRTIL